MPRLSIVIPWTGPLGPFEDTLASVLQNRPSGCEILVACATTYDDPHHLAGEVTFLPPPDRARDRQNPVALANLALARASAPVIHVVRCGMCVTEGWTSAAVLHFDDPAVAAVAPALLHPGRGQRLFAAGIDFAASGNRVLAHAGRRHDIAALVRTTPLGATFSGGFFRKSLLDALGGFDASLGEFAADLDFALAAAELDFRAECEPSSVIVAAEKPAPRGTWREGKAAEHVYRRSLRLAKAHRSGQRRLLQVGLEFAWCAIQPRWLAFVLGRAAGYVESLLAPPPQARLDAARDALDAARTPAILQIPQRAAGSAAQRRRAA